MAGHYVRRHPKGLVLYIRGCPLEELLERHLELRNRVMKELGISAVQDTSLQGYRERVRQRMKERRQAFLERDILGEWPQQNGSNKRDTGSGLAITRRKPRAER